MIGRTLGVALAVVLVTGCAAPPPPPPRVVEPPRPVEIPVRNDVYVLLPSPNGDTGSLVVTRAGEEQTLGTAYASVRIGRSGTLEKGVINESQMRDVFGEVMAALPPRPTSFLLYFLVNSDEFTPESKAVVEKIFAAIAGRPVPEIVVIGHTDTVGSVDYNDNLSLQRAEKIRGDLIKLGLSADSIQVSGRGKRELLIPTGDQVLEPSNRRVEIVVR